MAGDNKGLVQLSQAGQVIVLGILNQSGDSTAVLDKDSGLITSTCSVLFGLQNQLADSTIIDGDFASTQDASAIAGIDKDGTVGAAVNGNVTAIATPDVGCGVSAGYISGNVAVVQNYITAAGHLECLIDVAAVSYIGQLDLAAQLPFESWGYLQPINS